MGAQRYVVVTTVLLAGALLAGCGADSQSDSASSTGAKPAQLNERAEGGAPGAETPAQGAPEQGKNTPAQAPDLRVDQRSIIYTGTLTVRVKNVAESAAKATGIAGGAGGFVGGDQRTSGEGSEQATIRLRVPADKFGTVVDQLAGLGEPESRDFNTEDVTEQVVDLDARITVQQARVASGRRLLAQAKSLEDLVMLEKEVATRESDLASLEAKKRRLADLAALSTVTVVLLGPNTQVADNDDDPAGFLGGLQNGWAALVASMAVLLTVLGTLLPWLLLLGLPAWAVWYALRKHRRGRRPAPTPAPAEQP